MKKSKEKKIGWFEDSEEVKRAIDVISRCPMLHQPQPTQDRNERENKCNTL